MATSASCQWFSLKASQQHKRLFDQIQELRPSLKLSYFFLHSSTHKMVFKDISMINSRTACKPLPTTNALNCLFHFRAALIVTGLSQNLGSFHVSTPLPFKNRSSGIVDFFFLFVSRTCSRTAVVTSDWPGTQQPRAIRGWLDFSSPTDLKRHRCCCNVIFR